jgi:trehalose synthase
MQVGIERIPIEAHITLKDYAAVSSLAPLVQQLRDEAQHLQPKLAGRRIWMLSSTAAGGGVAEMMPQLVALLGELGVDARWLVMRAEPTFFQLTKRLHNLIHGTGDPGLAAADRELYEAVSCSGGAALANLLSPRDLLVVHDPQPLGMGALAKRTAGVRAIWRCHIGHGEDSPQAVAAWQFLRPYADAYDRVVFSSSDFIRDFLAGRALVMRPSIDPLDHKNRHLPPTKIAGILANAGLLQPNHPVLMPPFAVQARRLRSDGVFAPAVGEHEIGLLFRPLVVQISRWDRLKGFEPLLDAFCALKARAQHVSDERHRRRLEIARLVLAGPDPAGVQDDPEAYAVLRELSARYRKLSKPLADDIALLVLPMESRKQNALVVNCLQRCAVLGVQNSVREGFSLTVTETMWKGVAILGSRLTGIRAQVRDHLDGRLLMDPFNPAEIAEALDEMLAAAKQRVAWGRNAHTRVHDSFLIFRQVRDWLRLFAEHAS